MQKEIKIEPLFKEGTEVIEDGTKRVGVISKVRTKINKLSLTNFEIEVSYSVFRESGYNSFRSLEENLREIVYDYEGEPQVLPKGTSSNN